MKLLRILFISLLSASLFFSCTPSKKELLNRISSLEEKMKNLEADYDIEAATELENTYVDFIENYKDDSIYADILFNAGSHATTNKSSRLAVDLLTEFVEKFPENEKIPEAYVDLAIVYELQMFDLENAEKYLLKFKKEFPEHELIEVVNQQYDNLGKTPEEIMEEILKKQQEEPDSVAL